MRAAFALLVGGLACSFGAGQPAPEQLPTKATYKLGPDSQKQDGVPAGELIGPVLFKSKVFDGTVRQYWVYVPAQYKPENAACVLVFQDGQRAINPKGVIRAPVVLDNLIHRKEIPVTIGIFVTPGHKGTEYPASLGTGNPNNRSVEYDSLGDAFAKLIVDEMLPEVAQKYTLTKDPNERAIAGFSSGGIAAFTVAWERPEAFRRVYSAIGSFTNLRGGHVYPDLVRKADAKPIRVYVQDGVHDNRSPMNTKRDWFLQNQLMVEALREKDYDYKYVLGAGGHADDHGGALLPDALRWLWRDHAAVKGK
ncbi:esterase family protein [Gemmata sp. G18]|uniref:Esterase family protein n=1 Tax=Gemmata palustris TaxID=2822762 RepID=A0ABS5C2E2_9BACT|nr:alpha/beta hydrolase-fold protein [Gemmata palustris]MBP3960152.1 esterase family protein [Gemmata palustris]